MRGVQTPLLLATRASARSLRSNLAESLRIFSWQIESEKAELEQRLVLEQVSARERKVAFDEKVLELGEAMRALRASKQEVAEMRISALTTKQQLEATMVQQKADAAEQLETDLRDQRVGLDTEINKLRGELDRAMLRIGELQLLLSQAPKAADVSSGSRGSLVATPGTSERKQKPIARREKKSATAAMFEGVGAHEMSLMSPSEVMQFLVRYIQKVSPLRAKPARAVHTEGTPH